VTSLHPLTEKLGRYVETIERPSLLWLVSSGSNFVAMGRIGSACPRLAPNKPIRRQPNEHATP